MSESNGKTSLRSLALAPVRAINAFIQNFTGFPFSSIFQGFSSLIFTRLLRFLLNPAPLLLIVAIIGLFWQFDPMEWMWLGIGYVVAIGIARLFFPFSYRDSPCPKVRHTLFGSLWVRQLDTGSCNAEELEITALESPVYDVQRIGVKIKSSPRHADVILMTGPLTRNLKRAALRTLDASPQAKIIRVGDAAIDGGIFKGSYALVERPRPGDPLADRSDPAMFFFASECLDIKGNPPCPREMIEHLA